MRNELLQERASRQDLECDKMALERQVHTLLSAGKQLHTLSRHERMSQQTNFFTSSLHVHSFFFIKPAFSYQCYINFISHTVVV